MTRDGDGAAGSTHGGAPDDGVQRQRTRRRRKEILDVASTTFAERGFYNSSLAEIAAEVGITAAGILHHFKSKDQLLTALLHARDQLPVEEGGHGSELHGRQFLRHLVDTAERNSARPNVTQLYAVLSAESVTRDHPAQEWFRSRYSGLRAMVVEALAEARDVGELRDDADLEETATAIIAVMDGLQIQWLLSPDEVDMAAVTRRTIDALLASLAPGGAKTGE
ncbi:transcriptional regulator, TetR family [Beutenbergia cavernae DSM 12333]|uniref:Transcriptional regulator, TetR family n=1 Tax=Beutenbergia cavernae (strain ATCC BAA-8 / DSM 12333 / CCUG 43141 / JCM 11478 / NBRC 16432 / NCIMB 13614 / HKI 0122) TaxID=471853 RepID=C5C5E4_BEUC1|nr:TetR/AcrR family transcriptional regulator [Beutenbergia cavernae]ACQ82284.1 transcriptional regulator, TetR family [Beutenbergia cavernae DSM 12333]